MRRGNKVFMASLVFTTISLGVIRAQDGREEDVRIQVDEAPGIPVWMDGEDELEAMPGSAAIAWGFVGDRTAFRRGARWGGSLGGGGMAMLLRSPRLKEELGLSEEQAEKLHDVVVENHKSTVRSRADLQVHFIELREMLREDNPPKAQVEKKVQEIAKLQGDLMKVRVNGLLSAKSILTPEEQKKARELLSERRRAFFMRRGKDFNSDHGSRGRRGYRFRGRHRRPHAPAKPESPKGEF